LRAARIIGDGLADCRSAAVVAGQRVADQFDRAAELQTEARQDHAVTADRLDWEDGRCTFRFFEPSMGARLRTRRTLELDLRNALAADAVFHVMPS
jgi:hypothetical protein